MVFVLVWEFRATRGCEKEFERAYGPDGEWVRFFKSGEGYLKTELLRDVQNPVGYLTVDYWISQTAYETFRKKWLAEYEALDRKCESLTEHERQIGTFFSES